MSAASFPREFQRSVLRLMLCDREVLASNRMALDGSYFTDESYRWIAECSLKVFDAAGALPSQGSVLEAALDGCPAGLDGEEIETEIGALYEDGIPEDARYVLPRLLSFAKHQKLRAAAAEAEECLSEGRFDEWVEKVNSAALISVDTGGSDLDFADFTFKDVEREYAGALPTGLGGGDVDQYLDGGGLCPGELGLFLGLPGYHKTTALATIGQTSLKRGLRVAHFTYEVSSVKLAMRYAMSITGSTKSEAMLNQASEQARLKRWIAAHGGSLKIHYAPEGTETLGMLEGRLKLWEARHGWKHDILLVDYGALLKPPDVTRDLRFQVADLYNGLRRIAGVWRMPVWSAQQAGREAVKAMQGGGVISMMNAAESFEPIRRADVVLTLNQTDEERQDGHMRLHGAKVREGKGGFTVGVRIDASRYTFSPLIDDTPPEPPDDEDDADRRHSKMSANEDARVREACGLAPLDEDDAPEEPPDGE